MKKDNELLDYFSKNNMLSDFREALNSVVEFSERENIEKFEKLLEKKFQYKEGKFPDKDICKVLVKFKSEYTPDTGYLFWLPSPEIDIYNALVYFPYIGVEKEGTFQMWLSIIQLIESKNVAYVKILKAKEN
jgi:hypothetical protein